VRRKLLQFGSATAPIKSLTFTIFSVGGEIKAGEVLPREKSRE